MHNEEFIDFIYERLIYNNLPGTPTSFALSPRLGPLEALQCLIY